MTVVPEPAGTQEVRWYFVVSLHLSVYTAQLQRDLRIAIWRLIEN